jgi:hypothetical protein
MINGVFHHYLYVGPIFKKAVGESPITAIIQVFTQHDIIII